MVVQDYATAHDQGQMVHADSMVSPYAICVTQYVIHNV